MQDGAVARLVYHLTHPLPLLAHLILRTESHAYSAALAFFALVGFYPFCVLLLSLSGPLLQWGPGEAVILETLREYYPEGQAFLVRNLDASVGQHGLDLNLASVFWILLGAAGVFVPLETAFNQLWGVSGHRPYWRNQAVGFFLTIACSCLAFLFVLTTSALQGVITRVPLSLGPERFLEFTALRLAALGFSCVAIFLFYRFLPNCQVRGGDVWPAAVAAGLAAEAVRGVYLLALPALDLATSQGPYYISISFALLAYVETFVVLGGAYVAARPACRPSGAAAAPSIDPPMAPLHKAGQA